MNEIFIALGLADCVTLSYKIMNIGQSRILWNEVTIKTMVSVYRCLATQGADTVFIGRVVLGVFADQMVITVRCETCNQVPILGHRILPFVRFKCRAILVRTIRKVFPFEFNIVSIFCLHAC